MTDAEIVHNLASAVRFLCLACLIYVCVMYGIIALAMLNACLYWLEEKIAAFWERLK